MIRQLQIPSQFESLASQTWSEIPDFAVIAGLNGAGKSQLLAAINNSIANPQHKAVKIPNVADVRGKTKYVDTGFSPKKIHQANQHAAVNLENRRSQLVRMLRGKTQVNANHTSLISEIKTRLGDTIDDLDDAELLDAFPVDLRLKMQDAFNNDYIGEVFRDYQDRVDQFKLKNYHKEGPRPTEKDIYRSIGAEPPWEVINTIF